jgi:hypothetical protein
MLLVGDAAGLAYTQSGEGIRPAIESGLLAAHTILEADGDYSIARLQGYNDRLVQRFGAAKPAGGWVPGGVRKRIGGWLLGRRWFTRHIVLDGWFLHRRQASV